MPAGFRRHLVGKIVINDFHCDIAEIHFVGKLVMSRDESPSLNFTYFTHKMAIVS